MAGHHPSSCVLINCFVAYLTEKRFTHFGLHCKSAEIPRKWRCPDAVIMQMDITMALPKDVKKVVLAYSGGLDTSIILKWLQTELGAEVVTFTADLGQGEELEPARKKAEMLGIKEIFVEDVREEFVRDFVFPMFRANTVYEGEYLLLGKIEDK